LEGKSEKSDFRKSDGSGLDEKFHSEVVLRDVLLDQKNRILRFQICDT
jgi:hypothetical protein